MTESKKLSLSRENRLLREILEQKRPTETSLEQRYGLLPAAAARLLLRHDLTQERLWTLGEESPIVEAVATTLLKAGEERIEADFQGDEAYHCRLCQEIALLKADAYVRGHRQILMGLDLAYELKKAHPYEFFGDGWLTGDSLLAFLLDLTPYNPVANGLPPAYFEELLNHGDYLPRLLVRKELLAEKGLEIAHLFALQEESDRHEIWTIRAALFRSSPLWLHGRPSSSPFGQMAQAQLDHLDQQYLCKIPLDEDFTALLKNQCEPYFQAEKEANDQNFPTTRESLFALLYKRSEDAPYAYEMSLALSKDKQGYWADRCPELQEKEKAFYQRIRFIQPHPYCFERAYEAYASAYLNKLKAAKKE